MNWNALALAGSAANLGIWLTTALVGNNFFYWIAVAVWTLATFCFLMSVIERSR
jgi:hypothetical protein